MKENRELTDVGCPEEAVECLNFDDFQHLYSVGKIDTPIKQFLGIP
jgi:hypothetical protein